MAKFLIVDEFGNERIEECKSLFDLELTLNDIYVEIIKEEEKCQEKRNMKML